MNWGIWGQGYHWVCAHIWGKDLTLVLAEAWGVEWYEVHEILLGYALFLVFWAYIVAPILIVYLIRRTK